MTNELAIRILTGDVLGTTEQTQEAIEMAVKALSQPDVPDTNVGDMISRHDAINLLKKWSDGYAYIDTETESAIKDFQHLPSVQKAIRPKFVAEDRYIKNYLQMFPHCPKCNYELETGDCYCRVCGCHIDWSEDDE